MQEKTITGMNFVRFMHEVVSAIKEGYTLTLEPQHAPVGYPNYSVTLVLEELVPEEAATEVALSEDEKVVLEEVKSEQAEQKEETTPAVVKTTSAKKQGQTPVRK